MLTTLKWRPFSLSLTPRRNMTVCLWLLPLFLVTSLAKVASCAAMPLLLDVDSSAYLAMARGPLSGLLASSKPPTVPLIYKLLGGEPATIVCFQVGLSAVAWGLLAWSVASSLRRTQLAVLAGGVILLFGTSGPVTMWNTRVLSESISISLCALVLAAGFWWLRTKQPGALASLVALVSLWALVRDSNAYVVPFLLVLLCIAMWRLRLDKKLLVLPATLLLVLALSLWSANTSGRWKFPLLNVIAQRVLTDPEATRYYEEHGMALTPALQERAGKWASSDSLAFDNDPRLNDFRGWLARRGMSTQLGYLLSHPTSNLRPLFSEAWFYTVSTYAFDLSGVPVPYEAGDDTVVVLATGVGHPSGPLFLSTFLLALLVACGAAFVRRGNVYIASAAALLALSVVLMFVAWHGDAMETARHLQPYALQVRLSIWLSIFFGLDSLLGHISTTVQRERQSGRNSVENRAEFA